MNTLINFQMLYSLVREKMRRDGKVIRDVSDDTGLSEHTVWRVTNDIGMVGSDAMGKLCAWLDISPDRLTGHERRSIVAFTKRKNESTLEVIHALILSDKHLKPEAQTALFGIMQVGYSLAVRGKGELR